jgi:hypothetical protein
MRRRDLIVGLLRATAMQPLPSVSPPGWWSSAISTLTH